MNCGLKWCRTVHLLRPTTGSLASQLLAVLSTQLRAMQAGIASWFVDEYTAVGNALRALKTSVSLDLYTAWWEQYRESDLVPRAN